MQRIAYFLVSAVLFSLPLYFVFAHEGTHVITISITDNGFVPNRITIESGDRVIWTNDGEKEHWPASGIHPTHSAYPEHSDSDCLGSSFDACHGLSPGESYSFTFNRVGKWSFHDHLNPNMTGVVEVLGDEATSTTTSPPSFISRMAGAVATFFGGISNWLGQLVHSPTPRVAKGESLESYIREQMTKCYKTGGKGNCYSTIAKVLIDNYSLADVMEAMTTAEATPAVYARCHEATHYLGRDAYEKNKSVPQSYAMCTEACWGGCYHGVMEQYFADKNFTLGVDDDKIAREMTNVCGTKKDYKMPGEFNECIHGLGHAMMFITNEDLPKSLTYCDLLPDRTLRDTCYGGVFMENSSSSTNRDHPSAYIDASDPLYPCDSLDEQYLAICYRYQSSYFAKVTNYDWKKVADMCELEPQMYKDECMRMIGSNQVGYTSDYSVMHADCALIPSEYEADCITGVVNSLGGRFKSDQTRMLDFCSGVETRNKEVCYNQAGHAEYNLLQDEGLLRAFCAQIAEQHYKDVCYQQFSLQKQ